MKVVKVRVPRNFEEQSRHVVDALRPHLDSHNQPFSARLVVLMLLFVMLNWMKSAASSFVSFRATARRTLH